MTIKTVISLALSALCFLSCDKQGAEKTTGSGELVIHEDKKAKMTSNAFKLMSFNVRYQNNDDNVAGNGWSKRCKGVYEMIRVQQPLVMGTQEMLISQRHDILTNVTGYKAIGVGRDDGAEKGESMSIFYQADSVDVVKWGTFWLSPSPDVPGVKGWDAACVRTCTWARLKHKRLGKEFFYFNTHLDHKGKVARTEEMKLIEKKMAELNPDGLPCAFSADFNTDENDAIFDSIKKTMLNARNAADVSDSHGTYNGFGNSSGKKIDHIWYNGLGVLEYKTVTGGFAGVTYISDHCPIYAVFTFN